MTARIVFVTPFPDAADLARQMAPDGFEMVVAKSDSPEYLAALADAQYLVGFVAGLVREELYAAAPNLKLVQLLSAGYDDADLSAARASGVPMCNNGGANSTAVSEHALMLMLAACRRLVWQHSSVAAGHWRGNQTPRVHELKGTTVGIVGLGTIGKKTARLANAFGCKVVYYDIARLAEHEEDALDVEFRLFNELLAEADIVSLHTPLNPSTQHLINADALARMKSSALLINTARGPVIDEAELIEALGNGTIAGAGLDVFDEEPPPADNPLFKLDNVTLSAHLAGPTYESHTARLRNGFDNVQRVARGETPLWIAPELMD
jgi:phosphoglycerate dehydrogenase-like enzyme